MDGAPPVPSIQYGATVESQIACLWCFAISWGPEMLEPDPGGGAGYTVSTHMLNSAASYLQGEATGVAGSRNAFNSACYTAEGAFGDGYMQKCFNDFFAAWFAALDDQAETLGSVADATQQCAVLYDHSERENLGDIAAMSIPKPAPASPPPQQPSLFGQQPQQWA
jgi:hypothetical protein